MELVYLISGFILFGCFFGVFAMLVYLIFKMGFASYDAALLEKRFYELSIERYEANKKASADSDPKDNDVSEDKNNN